MSTPDMSRDYTTGVPRPHHSLYIKDGNFVMQVRITCHISERVLMGDPKVENAIFKVHRSVLEKYSSVIEDMLDAPQGENTEGGGGTDEHPLVLTGDGVFGWELLLGWRYERCI
jgi:hypothetical protein